MDTYVVTGAFGYSGKYIAMRLLEQGHTVRTLTNSTRRANPFGGLLSTESNRVCCHGDVDLNGTILLGFLTLVGVGSSGTRVSSTLFARPDW